MNGARKSVGKAEMKWKGYTNQTGEGNEGRARSEKSTNMHLSVESGGTQFVQRAA